MVLGILTWIFIFWQLGADDADLIIMLCFVGVHVVAVSFIMLIGNALHNKFD